MSEENKNEEVKEEKVEEEKVEAVECNGDCSECDCDCDDFAFEPIHKKCSCANIFSIVCKAISILYLILGSFSYVSSINEYVAMYNQAPTVADIAGGFISSILLYAVAIWAFGEIVNLINRIKEAIMY